MTRRPASSPALQQQHASSGAPLDTDTRRAMEARFRHDFGSVRVYNDAESAAAAEILGARAFTIGRHIVFGQNQYVPSTWEGSRLIAHELGHVVEQRGQPSAIQCKLIDQVRDEIKLDLANVRPGDTIEPVFGPNASKQVQQDTGTIVNAMAKTPRGIARLQYWVNLPEGIRLTLTSKVLHEDDRPVHGLSDDQSKPGMTQITISTAQLPDIGAKQPERYKYLPTEPLIGAVCTHESLHQTKENRAIKKQRDSLLDVLEAESNLNEDDPRIADAEKLNKDVEIEPIRHELTYLIEYDVLYPDKPSDWLSKNFEKFLGQALYETTVIDAVTGLITGGHLDASQRQATIDRYLLHKKPAPAKK